MHKKYENHKGFAHIFLVIVILIAVVASGSYLYLKKYESLPIPITIDMLKPKPTTPQDLPVPENISQAHNAFGINTLKILARDEGLNNVFISPSSIALALSMVYNGANGETKDAMQKVLQLQGLDITAVNEESLSLITGLTNPDPKVELSVANSVWARQGVDFKKEFLSTVEKYYNAELETLDFTDPSVADTINAWVDESTRGKIPTIVSPPIPADLVMYLINAVYFKGTWTTEFDKQLTTDRDFTVGDGSLKKHPLMKHKGNVPYLETTDFQSAVLPYGENERLNMYVFLPKDLNKFVADLNITDWNEWMTQYEETEGTILLPKFKMTYEKKLVPVLEELGMGVAFGGNADLTGIGEQLFINDVLHKTYVDVNEEGTEAAAVTSIAIIGSTSIPEKSKTFYMEVNRPFFFVIRDNLTQELLFMGTIQNPEVSN